MRNILFVLVMFLVPVGLEAQRELPTPEDAEHGILEMVRLGYNVCPLLDKIPATEEMFKSIGELSNIGGGNWFPDNGVFRFTPMGDIAIRASMLTDRELSVLVPMFGIYRDCEVWDQMYWRLSVRIEWSDGSPFAESDDKARVTVFHG